jgi:hypothetical protein
MMHKELMGEEMPLDKLGELPEGMGLMMSPPDHEGVPRAWGGEMWHNFMEKVSPEIEQLRLDVAAPEQVEINRAFDLAVALRQLGAPHLSEDELAVVKSGDVTVAWPQQVDSLLLRVEVRAPDCQIADPSRQIVLYRDHEPLPLYFQLTPNKTGMISILVVVYQAQDETVVGNTRLYTRVEDVVGTVSLTMRSYPLGLTNGMLNQLYEQIYAYFNLDELAELCFQLGIERENLSLKRRLLVIELIEMCLREGRILALQAACRAARPHLSWKWEEWSGGKRP